MIREWPSQRAAEVFGPPVRAPALAPEDFQRPENLDLPELWPENLAVAAVEPGNITASLAENEA